MTKVALAQHQRFLPKPGAAVVSHVRISLTT